MPRFRLFAGPNGSGKSSLYYHLKNTGAIHTEIYVSADRIEKDIRNDGEFNFNAYRVKVSQDSFFEHIRNSGLLEKSTITDLPTSFSLKGGILQIAQRYINSYSASFIATYLAERLFQSKQSFCFETVMSHPSKPEMFKKAEGRGFKTYLYFVYTENPDLNVLRVKLRAKQGGHDVAANKIRERFYRSFQLLKPALRYANEGFIIDNSDSFRVVAEQHDSKLVWQVKPKPESLIKYAGL